MKFKAQLFRKGQRATIMLTLLRMISLFVLLPVSSFSCVFADYGAHFELSGRVLDEADGSPVGGATATFLNTGLGKNRDRKTPPSQEMGVTDENGTIEASLDYRWARHTNLLFFSLRKGSGDRFAVQFSRPGYEGLVLPFRIRELPRHDGTVMVLLDEVKLKKNLVPCEQTENSSLRS